MNANVKRTLCGVLSVERVGNEKHFGFRLAIVALQRKPARCRRVIQRLAVQRDLMMRDYRRDFRHVVMFFLVGGFAGVGFGRSAGLPLSADLSGVASARRRRFLLAFIFFGAACFALSGVVSL